MTLYGKVEYWDERYTKDPEPFDWYQRFSGFKRHIKPLLNQNHRFLYVGCGTSRLGEELYRDGYKNVTNIDFSSVAIDTQKANHETNLHLTWSVMNVQSMTFEDASFDVVLDKGTMDAVLCSEGSVANAARMCAEISRVLKPDGVFVMISYGHPERDLRLSYLDKPQYNWQVEFIPIPKPVVGQAFVDDEADDGDEESSLGGASLVSTVPAMSGSSLAPLSEAGEVSVPATAAGAKRTGKKKNKEEPQDVHFVYVARRLSAAAAAAAASLADPADAAR